MRGSVGQLDGVTRLGTVHFLSGLHLTDEISACSHLLPPALLLSLLWLLRADGRMAGANEVRERFSKA